MANDRTSFFDLKVMFGLLVLLFGVLLFLRNLGCDIGMSLWSYWPAILIIFGIGIMVHPRENHRFITGAILVVVGGLLLLHNLEVIRFGWKIIWPLLLILVGFSIITGHIRHCRKLQPGTDQLDLSMLLGGGEFKFDSKELRGGKIAAILGGGTIDLRDADMASDEITVDIFTFMGGIELWVPVTWQVIMRGTPILGGMENKTSYRGADTGTAKPRKIIITGTAIFGGIEVKN
jgi:hypothetical protein